MWTDSFQWLPWLWNNFIPLYRCQMVIPQGKSCLTLSTTTQVANANLSAQILWPKHPQTVLVPLATRSLCLLRFFSCCAGTWRERTSHAMREKKSKIKIYEWSSILVTEYRPVHNEIAMTKPVPKQRHLRLKVWSGHPECNAGGWWLFDHEKPSAMPGCLSTMPGCFCWL